MQSPMSVGRGHERISPGCREASQDLELTHSWQSLPPPQSEHRIPHIHCPAPMDQQSRWVPGIPNVSLMGKESSSCTAILASNVCCKRPDRHPSPSRIERHLSSDATLSTPVLYDHAAQQLFPVETPHLTHHLVEKLDVEKNTVVLLASVNDTFQVIDAPLPDLEVSFRDLCLEEPVLRSDPDADILLLRGRSAVNIAKIIPNFQVIIDGTAGIDWLSPYSKLLARKAGDIANEKFDVDPKTVEYLRDVLNHARSHIPNEQRVMIRLTAEEFDRVPSPILSLSPPYDPGDVDLALGRLSPMLAIEESLPAYEASVRTGIERDFEAEFKATVTPIIASFADDLPSPNLGETLKDSTWQMRQTDVWLHHVRPESPLLSLEQIGFRTGYAEPTSNLLCVQSLIPSPQPAESLSTVDALRTVTDMIKPLAKLADGRLQRERLVDIDTTARVEVPVIESPSLSFPWQALRNQIVDVPPQSTNRRWIASVQHEFLSSGSRWSGVSSLVRQLQWSPFPARLGKISAEEDLEETPSDHLLDELELNNDLDIEALATRPSKPFLLHDAEADQELVEVSSIPNATSDQAQDSQTGTVGSPLSLPRKTEPHARASDVEHSIVTNHVALSMDALLKKRKRMLEESTGDKAQLKAPKVGRSWLKMNDQGLLAFMHLQGQVDRSVVEQSAVDIDQTQRPIFTAAPTAVMTSPNNIPEVSIGHADPLSLPIPAIKDPHKPYIAILSPTTMSNHRFTRILQTLLPNLDITSRDPLPNPASPFLDADITLSPSTGILVTSIQELQQKPLPNAGARSTTTTTTTTTTTITTGVPTFASRLPRTATQYEVLYVLVRGRPPDAGAHRADDSGPQLSAADAALLASLTHRTAIAEAEIRVLYVGGGEAQTARWAAALISRSGSWRGSIDGDNDGMGLTVDETAAERVLRAAGMNAFAAQRVLLAGSTGGLAGFVCMDARDRMRRYGPMMGGWRVLGRVSKVLDAGWMRNRGHGLLGAKKEEMDWTQYGLDVRSATRPISDHGRG